MWESAEAGRSWGKVQTQKGAGCLSFLIYKMGLKPPNVQNWQGDYISERL